MKILTQEEHRKYQHLCGKIGEDIDKLHLCANCPIELKVQCINDHAIIGLDAEVRIQYDKKLAEKSGVI